MKVLVLNAPKSKLSKTLEILRESNTASKCSGRGSVASLGIKVPGIASFCSAWEPEF